MKGVLRIAIVDPKDDSRDWLKNLLLGMDTIWLEAECARYEFFCDIVAQTNPDVALVSLDADVEKALAVVAKLAEQPSGAAVLVVSGNTEGQLILQAVRAGAKEFLPAPVRLEELVGALERLSAGRGGKGDGGSHSSRVISYIGAAGGVGATTLAVNMGCTLAHDPANSVVLIDLDLTLGDADVCLDLIPDYTLADVAGNINRLDFTLLKRSLARHSSGLFLLPHPLQMDEAALITADQLRRVIGLLKATFSHVLIDTSKSFSSIDWTAMELSDTVLLITHLDLPCLRNVIRVLTAFAQHEGFSEKVKIVLNRLGLEDGEISVKKAQQTIGRDIFRQVPNDWQAMLAARSSGVPLVLHAPKSKINQALMELTQAVCGTNGDRPPEPKRRLFSLFGS